MSIGQLRERYHGRVPLHTYFGVTLGLFGLFLLCKGAPWVIWGTILTPASAFLVYATLTRFNTAVYLYERGFVQIGPTRKLKIAVRSDDIVRTSTSNLVVRGAGPAIHHLRYMVHLRDGRMAEFGLQYMANADELYDQIVALRRV